MKAIYILGLLALVLLMASCTKTPVATGAVVSKEDVTVKSEQGEIKVSDSGDDSWCSSGSDWKMTSPEESASWKIDKLMAVGKYAGLCHVIYTTDTGAEQTTMDYYFDKEGKNGYVEIKLPNGQVSTQEWHG